MSSSVVPVEISLGVWMGTPAAAVSAAQHELDLAMQRYQGGAVGSSQYSTSTGALNE
jgi:hypothetical protein